MAQVALLDMVLETSNNPGTGTFVLNGAQADRRSFAAALPSGGDVYYFADDGSQAEWGIGTLSVATPNTLARKTIDGNTQNTKVPLNFTGSVRVYSSLPADRMPGAIAQGAIQIGTAQVGTIVGNSDHTFLTRTITPVASTLRIDFSGNVSPESGGIGQTTAWQMGLFLYATDSSGNPTGAAIVGNQTFCMTQGTIPQGFSIPLMATGLTPGAVYAVGATAYEYWSSNGNILMLTHVTNAMLAWLSA